MPTLAEHFRQMQGMCARYLEPQPYVAGNGMIAQARNDATMRDKLFIADMIYMLDGPEQRAAQGIEAATADETANAGSAEGESPVLAQQECAQTGTPT